MIEITIHGARGSFPVAHPSCVRHGGATTCIEIGLDSDLPPIIIDCGTGLAELGRHWGQRNEALFLQTHFHWDHIQGFPFFAPVYQPGQRLEFWAVPRDGNTLKTALSEQMRPPNFPITMDMLASHLCFRDIVESGEHELAPGTSLRWSEMVHPSGCTAYRLDHRGTSFVFSGDVEVRDGCWDALVELAHGADVLLMDAQYLPSEYESKRGFGHSTCIDAVDIALEARVGHLLLTHHDPAHDDRKLDQKLRMARAHAGNNLSVDNAWDGLTLRIDATAKEQLGVHPTL